jgi:acetylornithine deacetylase/succinyl-diaminopimelate desuccinylase-like protein
MVGRPAILFALSLAAAPLAAQTLTPDQQLARDIFAQLIGINTTHAHGSTGPAARAIAQRFKDAGFADSDVQIAGPNDEHLNVVARLRGTGARRPILLLAHLDVVEALRSDWTLEPFTLTERDGYFYGRGTSDVKDMGAIFAATLIRLKREGFHPGRDIIVALTAGEEGGPDNGVQWLLTNRKALIDAAYCINGDGGGPLSRNGVVYANNVQASEKVYMDLQLAVRNAGGHSSLPVPDNAIYRLASALTRVARYTFPARLNPVTRAYFERDAAVEPPAVAADMRRVAATMDTAAIGRLSTAAAWFNAQVRTTCVATMLNGGHAPNALPQLATANVNCRLLPDEVPDSVIATLERVIDDTAIEVTVTTAPVASPPSPLVPEVMEPVERITAALWPRTAVVPNMETGATDGLYLRNVGMPVYGISSVALDVDDIRAHGRDERIRVAAYYTGLAFTYLLVKALGARQ